MRYAVMVRKLPWPAITARRGGSSANCHISCPCERATAPFAQRPFQRRLTVPPLTAAPGCNSHSAFRQPGRSQSVYRAPSSARRGVRRGSVSPGKQLGPPHPVDALGDDDLDMLSVTGIAAIGAGAVPPTHPVARVPRGFDLGGFLGCRSGAPLRCATRLAARMTVPPPHAGPSPRRHFVLAGGGMRKADGLAARQAGLALADAAPRRG